MRSNKQYEIWFTENNQIQGFSKDIFSIEMARIVAESFKRIKERSNVRILEMSNFDYTITFNI